MNFGRYKVIREIGKGAMGVVYLAHDPNLDLQVALKVLRQDKGVAESFARRFLAEARALGRLNHPNIVRVFNVDEDDGKIYIAMEFIEGTSFDETIRQKRFTPEEVATFGIVVASALDDAHRKGIVHRDIKPSNILVGPDGNLKITDFGIARIEDTASHEQTQAGEILGTPAYMSPEQVLSGPVDGRSDLFSLGILLYELGAGARPFAGGSLAAVFKAITQDEPAPITDSNPSFPGDLSRVIMKCLRKEPDQRFETAKALAAALKGCIGEESPVQATPPTGRGGSNRKTAAYLGAGLAVAALVAVLAYRQGFRKEEPAPKTEQTRGVPERPEDAKTGMPAQGKTAEPPVRDEKSVPVVPIPKEVPKPPPRASSIPQSAAKDPVPPVPDPLIEEDLQDAVKNYEAGRYDVAIVKLEYILRREKNNIRAREYLDKARAERQRVLEGWKKGLEEAPVSGGRKR